MDDIDCEITDPSDWPIAEWQDFDTALRCSICKEYFVAAMLLPTCSHNFCSLCIRQCFSNQTTSQKICPTCRAPAEQRDLKNNRVLDDLVRHLTAVRQQTIDALTKTAEVNGDAPAEEEQQSTPKLPTTSRRIMRPRPAVTSVEADTNRAVHGQEQEREEADPDIQAAEAIGTKSVVTCPNCMYEFWFTNAQLNRHLDECLAMTAMHPSKRPRIDSPLASSSVVEPNKAVSVQSAPCKGVLQRGHRAVVETPVTMNAPPKKKKPIQNKLIKPWFSGMKDNKLKSLLAEHRLPIHGDRKTMEKRYTHYLNMWNAACDDAQDFRTQKDLVKEVMQWERTQGKSERAVSDLNTHARKYQSEFEALIASTRNRQTSSNVGTANNSDDMQVKQVDHEEEREEIIDDKENGAGNVCE